jgi:hypothetical protein
MPVKACPAVFKALATIFDQFAADKRFVKLYSDRSRLTLRGTAKRRAKGSRRMRERQLL